MKGSWIFIVLGSALVIVGSFLDWGPSPSILVAGGLFVGLGIGIGSTKLRYGLNKP